MDSQIHAAPRKLIEDALAILRDKYIFPDKAEEAAVAIEARLAAGEYDNLDDETLGALVTEQLFAICADKHLRMRTRSDEMRDAMTPEEELAAWNEGQRLSNYRIVRAERLDGNVGYLDIRGVTSPDVGWRAIAAAMELVTHTEMLIIDLRKSGVATRTGYSCGTATSSPTPEPTSTASTMRRPSRLGSTGPWPT